MRLIKDIADFVYKINIKEMDSNNSKLVKKIKK